VQAWLHLIYLGTCAASCLVIPHRHPARFALLQARSPTRRQARPPCPRSVVMTFSAPIPVGSACNRMNSALHTSTQKETPIYRPGTTGAPASQVCVLQSAIETASSAPVNFYRHRILGRPDFHPAHGQRHAQPRAEAAAVRPHRLPSRGEPGAAAAGCAHQYGRGEEGELGSSATAWRSMREPVKPATADGMRGDGKCCGTS
jgi:hypothetical protein